MKQLLQDLPGNDLLLMLMHGTIAYTAFCAMMITVLQTPPEAILDSGLDQIILVFEGTP